MGRMLVTGGAGFIGSHLVDALLQEGHEVVVYDSLTPEVHGENATRPSYLDARARLIQADVRDTAKLYESLSWAEVVFHQAAALGVGRSMYEISTFVETNTLATAKLCEFIAQKKHNIQKVIVASSMSNYGEGRYLCPNHGKQSPPPRGREQLIRRQWELMCQECKELMRPIATDEEKPMHPHSVYATTKRDQEELILNIGRAYGVPSVALRYFNVYGARQALSNPYTGVAAIFCQRLLRGESPMYFEDGEQSRDFIHVSDIVQANLLALSFDKADGQVFNVGTGVQTTLRELGAMLAERIDRSESIQPKGSEREAVQAEKNEAVQQKYREGDTRHCFADISKITRSLGFAPKVSLEEGVDLLISWAREIFVSAAPLDVNEALVARRLIF